MRLLYLHFCRQLLRFTRAELYILFGHSYQFSIFIA